MSKKKINRLDECICVYEMKNKVLDSGGFYTLLSCGCT